MHSTFYRKQYASCQSNYNLSLCSLYKTNVFALVEVTGYSMHTVWLIVCESSFLLLLTRCCHYVPALEQVVVLKCVLCVQTLSEAQQICCWTWVGLKAVPREGAVTSMHHSAQKPSYNSSLHILLLKYLVLTPPYLFFLPLYISNSLLVCPQPASLFTTCCCPVLLAQVPSLASCVNENGMFQIAEELLCWNLLI